MSSRSKLFGIVACSVLLYVRGATASPLLELVGDSNSTGGLQARTIPGGSAAAYFNPALLVDTPATLSVGVTVTSEQIGVSLDGRPSTQFAVPEGIQNAGRGDGTRLDAYPIATKLLQRGRAMTTLQSAFAARPRQGVDSGHVTRPYGVLGIVVKLFDERLTIGLHALIPIAEFTNLRAFYADEREQYFSNSLHPELYGDRMTALSIATAAGIRITDALSLGVGATLSLSTSVGAQAFVADTGNLSKLLLDTNAPIKVGIAPHFGASYVFGKRFRLSATAHAPESVKLETKFTFLLANGIQQASSITFVHDYMPWQLGLGGSYELIQQPDATVSLTASLLYGAWSAYLDRHGERPSAAYAWADTLSPTVGVRARIGRLSTFVDVSFQPSPVPLQTGRTNYVDNDRLGSGLGAEYQWMLWGSALRIGAQLQLHRLLPRHQSKIPTPTKPDGVNRTPDLVRDEVPDDTQIGGDPLPNGSATGLQTNNPGWPGFGSEGWLLGAGLYLSVAL